MKKYIKTYGTSYYLANIFFPQKIKNDVITLYAWVRVPDNIVDEYPDVDSWAKQSILDTMWKIRTDQNVDTLDRKQTHDVIDYSERSKICTRMRIVQHTYAIPEHLFTSFWEAMEQDLKSIRYTTTQQLQDYMYGSAQVVGLIMCYIIWRDDQYTPQVLKWAKHLWEAMQLTNFYRDIKEDYLVRDRIYIPEEGLCRYGLSHQDIIVSCHTWEVWSSRVEYMRHHHEYIRSLYAHAHATIPYLSLSWRTAVILAARLYEAILDTIESKQYNVFAHDAHTSRLDKVFVLIKYFCTR